jgi:hypothetical protein
MNEKDFEELPPKMFMMQIMDTLAKIYCFLWEKKDDQNRYQITWEELSKYYNKNSFRTSLRKLSTEGLLNYHETNDGIAIELVDWDDLLED